MDTAATHFLYGIEPFPCKYPYTTDAGLVESCEMENITVVSQWAVYLLTNLGASVLQATVAGLVALEHHL